MVLELYPRCVAVLLRDGESLKVGDLLPHRYSLDGRRCQYEQVKEMADWAEYLKAKGVPLPLSKTKVKWA